MTRDRDVRLSDDQIRPMIDACRRRERQLRKSIAADSGTFHRALADKERSLADLASGREALEVAAEAIRRSQVAALRSQLGMDR